MTTEQEKINEDLEETMISHSSEILEECLNENKAQAAKDNQKNNVIKSTYDGVQMTESTGMLNKRNDEAKELASKLKDD
ncbi:17212_t:CDS:1, partial [Acaulospora morrowiae]